MSFQTRRIALDAALAYQTNRASSPRGSNITSPDELVQAAEKFERFLIKDGDPFREILVVVRYGPVVDQASGTPVAHPLERKNGMTQIHDSEQYSVTIEAVDAKGFEVTGDTFSATSADTSIATVTQQADGTFLTVAGNVGSTVITYTDGTLSVTDAVDVVAGAAALLKVTAGAPEPQPAAAAPGDGSGTPTTP